MTDKDSKQWIDDIEISDAQIKWAWSHFDGRADTFNDKGDYNFQLILTPEQAKDLGDEGWAVREMPGFEEGDPPEYLLKVKISYRFEAPKIYIIKNGRKMRAEEADLADIKRGVTEKINVIITPSRWVSGRDTGISAYAKELYAYVKQSRFEAEIDQYEDI